MNRCGIWKDAAREEGNAEGDSQAFREVTGGGGGGGGFPVRQGVPEAWSRRRGESMNSTLGMLLLRNLWTLSRDVDCAASLDFRSQGQG